MGNSGWLVGSVCIFISSPSKCDCVHYYYLLSTSKGRIEVRSRDGKFGCLRGPAAAAVVVVVVVVPIICLCRS